MQSELISIIVPVYNVQKYLCACLESLINQTYDNLQIILVDDGSTDESSRICDEWANREQKVTVVHQENEGLSAARNHGLELAEGSYIAFVDSDDMVHPQYCEMLYHAVKDHDADMAICQYQEITDVKEIAYYGNTSEQFDFAYLADKNRVLNHFMDSFTYFIGVVWNKIYKRTLIGETRFEQGTIIEDLMFNAEIATKINKVCVINNSLYYYLRREDSITGKGRTDNTMACIHALIHNSDIFSGQAEEFQRKYKTYALNSIAFRSGRARVLHHKESGKQAEKVFRQYYHTWNKDIIGLSMKLKLLIIYLLPGPYYYSVKKKVYKFMQIE